MDLVASALTFAFGGVADLLRRDLTVRSALVVAVGALVVVGHLDRRIERFRFGRTLRAQGFRRYSLYVASSLWRTRRRRWLAETGRRPCRICARPWRDNGRFHAHHVDYAHAGAGQEPDRDLVPICSRCHTLVHAVDRALRPAGVSLRRCTGLVAAVAWPLRLLRPYLPEAPDVPTDQTPRPGSTRRRSTRPAVRRPGAARGRAGTRRRRVAP